MKYKNIKEGMLLYAKPYNEWVNIEYDYHKHNKEKDKIFGVSSYVPFEYDAILKPKDLSRTDPNGNTEPDEKTQAYCKRMKERAKRIDEDLKNVDIRDIFPAEYSRTLTNAQV